MKYRTLFIILLSASLTNAGINFSAPEIHPNTTSIPVTLFVAHLHSDSNPTQVLAELARFSPKKQELEDRIVRAAIQDRIAWAETREKLRRNTVS